MTQFGRSNSLYQMFNSHCLQTSSETVKMTGQGLGREDLKVAKVAINPAGNWGSTRASQTQVTWLRFWGFHQIRLRDKFVQRIIWVRARQNKKLEAETEKWNSLKHFEIFCAVRAWRHPAGGKKHVRYLQCSFVLVCGLIIWGLLRLIMM